MSLTRSLSSPLPPDALLARLSAAVGKINYAPMGTQPEWPGVVGGGRFILGYAGREARKQNCYFCGSVVPEGSGSRVTGMFRTPLRLYIILTLCFVAAGLYLGSGESVRTSLTFGAAALGASAVLYAVDGIISQQFINSAARKVLFARLCELAEAEPPAAAVADDAGDDESPEAESRACPKCGRALSPDARFCDSCGFSLQGETPDAER